MPGKALAPMIFLARRGFDQANDLASSPAFLRRARRHSGFAHFYESELTSCFSTRKRTFTERNG